MSYFFGSLIAKRLAANPRSRRLAILARVSRSYGSYWERACLAPTPFPYIFHAIPSVPFLVLVLVFVLVIALLPFSDGGDSIETKARTKTKTMTMTKTRMVGGRREFSHIISASYLYVS